MPSSWITGAARRCSALLRVGTQRFLSACWRLAAQRSARTTLGSRCCTAQRRAVVSSWWRSAWTWGLTLWLRRSWGAACCTLLPLVGHWLDLSQMLCLSPFAADVSKGCCKLPRKCLDQVPTPWPLCGWRTLLHFAAVRELCLDLEAEALPRTQRDAVPFLVPPGSQVCLNMAAVPRPPCSRPAV